MSAFYQGSLVPLAVLVWPLLVGLVPVVPRWRARAVRVLPLAPLPALGFAMAGAPGELFLPDLMLGVHLAAVPGATLFLAMTALVWTVAGWHAALTLRAGPQAGIFAGFWCLTLAGNLGVFLAGDVVTFYLAFAAVSLAAWFLVVHDRTAKALAAGRLYITLAVLGEAALLVGLMIGAAAADDLRISSVREALSDAPMGQLGLAALVVGFGIKAGMVPLHLWLPVAHPAAPVPGSAVLSGAIVKAGLIGMVLFLPQLSGWQDVLIVLGLVGGFGAALWGLTQRNPKAVLAYSPVSQMGLLLVLVGTGSGGVAYYALHHGLAKGALFLGVGVLIAAATRQQRRAVLVVAGIVALSVAGLPPAGGALAKLAAKDGLPAVLVLALTLSGVTTTLVLGWFLVRLAQLEARPEPRHLWRGLFAGCMVLAALALVLPWVLWEQASALPLHYPLRSVNLLAGFWPVLLGIGCVALVCWRNPPALQPGDMLALLPERGMVVGPKQGAEGRLRRGATARYRRMALRALLRSRRADIPLQPWPRAGLVLFAGALALAALIGRPG
ncbi:MAG: NADH dehydrogenase [Rhodobacteraceae bacterium]|nr:NADH dehydrogenase [Paracoccaceae bacterium]